MKQNETPIDLTECEIGEKDDMVPDKYPSTTGRRPRCGSKTSCREYITKDNLLNLSRDLWRIMFITKQ